MKQVWFSIAIMVGLGLIGGNAMAATRTWDGGGTPNNGGSWQTNANWTGPDLKPGSGDVAALADVSSGARVVTNEAAEAISQLSMTQTTGGATNRLLLNADLSINNATPYAITPTAGQNSLILDLASGVTLQSTNNGALTLSLGGTINLAANSILKAQTPTGNNNITPSFAGPINANGAGTQIRILSGQFFNPPTFAGPISVNGAGSSLAIFGWTSGWNENFNQAITFSGAGNAVNVGDGATLTISACAGNLGGYIFTTPVTLGAGAVLNLANGNSNGTQTARFNGLTLGVGATNILRGTELAVGTLTPVTLAGAVSFSSNSFFQLDFNGGNAVLSNAPTASITQDATTINLNWSNPTAGNPSGARKFINSGNWTLKNNAKITFTSTTGRPTGFGYGNMVGNINAGTMRILSGSTVAFSDFGNRGTLILGTNAVLATAQFNGGDQPLNNTGSGAVSVLATNAMLGYTNAAGQKIIFNNGSASGPQGAVLTLGDGVQNHEFVIRGRDVYLSNYAGNTVTVNRASALRLIANTSVAEDYNNRAATLTNAGVLANSGLLQFQPNHGPPSIGIINSGTFMVGTGSAATSTIQRMPGMQSAFYDFSSTPTVFANQSAGVLTGNGLFLHINSTGSSVMDYLKFGNAGTIVPTVGGRLTIQNAFLINTGLIDVNNATLILANSILTNSATVSVRNGSLLEANTIVQPAGSISNWGGVYQFSAVNPTVRPTTVDTIVLTNGTISFRAVTNADVFANWAGGNQLTNILYQGANGFRLDAASNTAAKSQSYTFAASLGATNYTRLEMLNGALYRAGTVTIGNGGMLVVSNGTSTISSNLTFLPGSSLAVCAGTNATGGALNVGGVLNLSGVALQLALGHAPVENEPYVIFTNPGTAAVPGMGTFASGSVYVDYGGKTYRMAMRYGAGDGNDVAVVWVRLTGGLLKFQ
jgi:hypothetical protein